MAVAVVTWKAVVEDAALERGRELYEEIKVMLPSLEGLQVPDSIKLKRRIE